MAKRGPNVADFPPVATDDRQDALLEVESELFNDEPEFETFTDNEADDAALLAQQARNDQLVAELTLTDYTIEYMDRVFVIEEPDMDMLTALVRFAARLALRGEKIIGQNFKGLFVAMSQNERTKQQTAQSVIPIETTLFSILSALQANDIQTLGVLVLFGGTIDQMREGDAWFKQIGSKNLKFNVIVKALAYRIVLSEDLALSLKNFALVQAAGRVWTMRNE